MYYPAETFFRRRGSTVIGLPRYLVVHHTGDHEHSEQEEIVNRNHENRGYPKSSLQGVDSHVAYHFMIGKDGTVKQLRDTVERTGHTKTQPVNLESIAIVLTGNFEVEYPTEAQMRSLKFLIERLDKTYHFEKISGHRFASSSSCPGKNLLQVMAEWGLLREPQFPPVYNVTRYYTPVTGQLRYYRDDNQNPYEADFKVNCWGDCFKTADGTDLRTVEPMTSAACPPEMSFGTKIYIEGMDITVTCHDHGSAIKGNRIDVWAGAGHEGLQNILTTLGGQRFIKILK